jgi:hypothetical protein
MSTIEIGTIYSYKPEDVEELRLAVEEIFQEPVENTQIPSLAGPNDIIQILFNPEVQEAVVYIASKISDKVIDTVIDAGWGYLAGLVVALRNKGTDVGVGVKIPTREDIAPSRNAMLIIKTNDPIELSKSFKSIAYCAEEIAKIYAEHEDNQSYTEWGDNPDQSAEIVVLENGDVKVLGRTIQGPNH